MGAPVATTLVDSFGRVVRDLRVSVTDRCNLRCSYCIPHEDMSWLGRDNLLDFDEIERVVRICVERFALQSVRITGGEPTVRAELPVLVARLAALGVDLALTTNGMALRLLAGDLRRAGLGRVNVSLDTLCPERFVEMTRRPGLARVLDGIGAAVAAGLRPLKLNCVVVRGVNDAEIVDLAEFARNTGVALRFIEFMPLDAGGAWSRAAVVTAEEILATVGAVHPLEPVGERGSEPAERYRYLDGRGELGVIASVTRPFCERCDRIRLTADGALRNCLFATTETDLRAVLRGGGSDDDVASAIAANVAAKGPGHQIGQVSFTQPARPMSRIGG